jgi:anion-transporting  ArsA/GET3 family ATPase
VRRDQAPRLGQALLHARVLVVAGPGGVGKTTTAAALGLRAAQAGRRVLVCTIDPSRRLATSLGLRALREEPRRLELGRVAPGATGSLFAMTLDTQHTFDALVRRHATSPEARQRILENRFYRQVSAALAGSHEYMAMEKLLELSREDRFDLVVLDTPPTRHALDFLEAPDRMLAFLDTGVLRYFLRPYFAAGRLTLRVATRTGALALKLADKALGLQFLRDLSEFFLAFDGMYDGFKERAAAVHALLRRESSGFVLVGSPQPEALSEVTYFHARLLEKGMPFVAFVVNRVHAAGNSRRSARAGATRLPPALERGLLELYADEQALARRERREIARLEQASGAEVVRVAELPADVHDLRGLAQVAQALLPAR